MTLAVARHIVLAARPQGTPHVTDFRLEDTAIRPRLPGSCSLGCSTCRSTPTCAS
jgi:hypothetical protein